MEKLWKLAEAARVTQDVFAGREVSGAHYLKEAGGRSIKYFLKEAVLSLRGMDGIISQWQKEGYKYELDYYVWKEFVSQSTQASDRAYLYQELKDRYGFFTSDGWKQDPNYGAGGVINSFNIGEAPKNPALERKFFGPREVIDFAYGKDNAPERTKWPEMNKDADVAQTSPAEVAEFFDKIKGLEVFKSSFENEILELKKELDEFCAKEGKTPADEPKTGFRKFFSP